SQNALCQLFESCGECRVDPAADCDGPHVHEREIRDDISKKNADDAIAGQGQIKCGARALDDAQKERKGDLKPRVADSGRSCRYITRYPGAREYGDHQAANGGECGKEKYDGRKASDGADETT